MEKQSIKKNFIFQILYQFVLLVLPLIISPYLTRVLGEKNLGVYTFTYSIAYYFVVFAMLGVARHGQRIIAARRNDEISLRKTFWSLFSVHSLFSLLAITAYFFFLFFQDDNKSIYYIQLLFVASALFDITWLFYGLENFKSVVIKNFIIKVISTILIFLLVKSSSDLWIYTIIMAGSTLCGHIVMIPQAIYMVKPIKFSFEDYKEHFKPMLALSIAVIASTLYTVFDKTLIGLYINDESVAYYEYAYKIIQIPTSIITVIGTVLFPRSCTCYANGDEDGLRKYFKLSVVFTYFISFGSIFGIIAVSDLFVNLYYGPTFEQSAGILKFLSPLVLIISFGDIIRTQYLIPMKKDLEHIVIIIINAFTNIVLSCIFLNFIGVYGAVIGTISAEFIGTILQMIICRKKINFKSIFKLIVPFLVSSLIMFIAIELVKRIINTSIFDLIIQIFVGGTVYLLFVCILLFIFEKKYLKNLFEQYKKNKL